MGNGLGHNWVSFGYLGLRIWQCACILWRRKVTVLPENLAITTPPEYRPESR
jgi:hypothetical protein